MSLRSCEEIRALLSDHLAGALEASAVRPLSSHLSACNPCRGHAEELFWQDRVLAELGIENRLDALMDRIREGLEEPPLKVSATGRVESRRPWLPWAVAAAACAAVVAGALIFMPRNDSNSDVVVEQAPPPAPGPMVVQDPDRLIPKTPESPVREKETVRAPAPQPVSPAPPLVRNEPKPVPEKVAPVKEVPKPIVKNVPVPDRIPKPIPAPARAAKMKPEDKVVIKLARRTSVAEAVHDGTNYLRAQVDASLARAGTAERKLADTELILWTLVHAGVPEHDPGFRKLFQEMMSRQLERTYRVALQAMILEELGRVKYQARIAQCAQFLVDNQCRNGQWSYGDPSIFAEKQILAALPKSVASARSKNKLRRFSSTGIREKPKVTRFVRIVKKREGRGSGDNSNSMYAALGLRACHDAGMLLPHDVVERAQKWWREAQKGKRNAARGWCYGGKSHADHPAYGSMTAGAVGSLAIYDYIQNKAWAKDPALKDGMAWLSKHFSVSVNPGTPEHGGGKGTYMYYYYMYALERAGMLVDTETIGKHDWYAEGERALLDAQHLNGSWPGGSTVRDTCFAILFLKRATTPLNTVSTGGRRK